MFDRNHWYPRLGFTDSLFLEDLNKHPEIHDCRGFFEGACDADIARFVHSILLHHRDRPQFVYWVTLNSHLPLPPSVGVGQNLDCSANGIADVDVCLWARLIFNVNDAIAQIASDPAIGPTEFLVVGDHGPPFWRTARRSLFSQTHVPYFRLIPRM
jgi:phosphoglycerol transferase MdoB-like AlkP superfamily enzyme